MCQFYQKLKQLQNCVDRTAIYNKCLKIKQFFFLLRWITVESGGDFKELGQKLESQMSICIPTCYFQT